MKPLFSVVIPTFRREEKLKDAIFSVLNQSIDPSLLEILVCEDGDLLKYTRTIDEFSDSRISYFPCEHFGGPASPRNVGINNSKGKWICFLDDDDTWHPNKLAYQLEILQAHNAHMCGQTICPSPVGDERLINTFEFFSGNPIITSSVVISRDLLCGLKFEECKALKGVEDYHLWLRLAMRSDWLLHGGSYVNYSFDTPDSIRLNASTAKSGLRELVFIVYRSILSSIVSPDPRISLVRFLVAFYQFVISLFRYFCLELLHLKSFR